MLYLKIIIQVEISFSFIQSTSHYDNRPMQYSAIFHSCKNDNLKIQNIAHGYKLEPPQ